MTNKMTFTWIASQNEEGWLLRDFLTDVKKISKRALTHIKFKGGKIEVNGVEVTVRYILRAGDEVSVTYPPEKVSEWIIPVQIPLKIVYEDDHVLVINKQPYLPTIPSRNNVEKSLAGAVIHYYREKQIPSTFHAVNRLDKNTSGMMLIAKHRYIHDLFSKMQRDEKIDRTYVALVHGVVHKDKGKIEAPIAKKETSIIEREVSPTGQHAVTHYKVIERFRDYTLLELRLETGRTHQIRVHMSHIGHPLAGDTLYGGNNEIIERQALHSKSIRFFHPLDEKMYEFHCPLAEDIESSISLLKN